MYIHIIYAVSLLLLGMETKNMIGFSARIELVGDPNTSEYGDNVVYATIYDIVGDTITLSDYNAASPALVNLSLERDVYDIAIDGDVVWENPTVCA